MQTMQDKLTGEVDALVAGLGLSAAQTYAAAANIGNYWIADGNATRLRVAWRYSSDHAEWTLTGPAADYARNAPMNWTGPVVPTMHSLGEGHTSITLRLNYAHANSAGDALAGLGAVLAPWRTAKSFDDELAAHRVALLDTNPEAGVVLGAARAALGTGNRAAAAHHVEEALHLLPEIGNRVMDLGLLADALAADPIPAAAAR